MKRKVICILSPEGLAQFKKNLTPETKDIKDVMALSGKILISPCLSPIAYPASAASEVSQQKNLTSTHITILCFSSCTPVSSSVPETWHANINGLHSFQSLSGSLWYSPLSTSLPPSLTDICEPLLCPQQHKQNSMPTSGFGCWWLIYIYIFFMVVLFCLLILFCFSWNPESKDNLCSLSSDMAVPIFSI